jgi:drug/metabolite transporter (DMT)-like permease
VGNLVASEPLTPRVLIAAAIIVTSVALITVTQGRRRKSKVAEVPKYSSGDD